MKILFLDTSSFFINIAIIEDNNFLFHFKEKSDNKLSDRIFSLIENAFAKANTKPQEIKKIYVTNGPGSFTGIRIGLTIAKTMAWDLNIPICTVSSLLMLASGQTKPVYAVIFDRNGYGYCALYNQNLVTEEEVYVNIKQFLKADIPVVSYQNEKEPTIDLLRIVKKYKNKQENVHGIKANYIKKMEMEK